jgi:molybdopterin synthase sulfur carrier subunit
MITIKIHTILTIKKTLGSGEVEFRLPERSTLGDLVSMMVSRWGDELSSLILDPKSRAALPHIRFMVNGRDIAFLNRMETVLRDGDEVLILPPVSGG